MSTYTEFYCDPVNGSNLNAGSTTGGTASVTQTNGGWNSGTGVFTAASGTPFSGVSVGEWASIYNDGATQAVFIGRITAIGGGGASITVSLTAAGGSPPTTSATTRSCKVGGCWKGPSGAVVVPFSIFATVMRDSSNNPSRINLKNNATYSVTAAIALPGSTGALVVEGYSSTLGDGGKATIDGGTTGASYILFTLNASQQVVRSLVLKNNGATGSQAGFEFSGQGVAQAISVSGMRGVGMNISGVKCVAVEVEVYGCNTSAAATGGFVIGSTVGSTLIRCISHDNGGTTPGFFVSSNAGAVFIQCIADTNGGPGFKCASQYGLTLIDCDSYNNTGDGADYTLASGSYALTYAENCNFVLNGGYGFNASTGTATGGTPTRAGLFCNCGFGSGSKANTSGAVLTALDVMIRDVGRITYSSGVTPWRAPATGDFTITSLEAINKGRGNFTEEQSGYTGTADACSVGAAGTAPSVVVSVSLG